MLIMTPTAGRRLEECNVIVKLCETESRVSLPSSAGAVIMILDAVRRGGQGVSATPHLRLLGSNYTHRVEKCGAQLTESVLNSRTIFLR